VGSARLDRVAIVVSDLDEVAKDLKSVFDMDFTVVEAASLGIRAGLGNDGIELVDKLGDESPLERLWRPPLAALVIRCDDIDAATERMEAAGFTVDHKVTTPGGLREVSFGDSFHGIPLTLCQSDKEDLLEATRGDQSGEEYDTKVDWA